MRRFLALFSVLSKQTAYLYSSKQFLSKKALQRFSFLVVFFHLLLIKLCYLYNIFLWDGHIFLSHFVLKSLEVNSFCFFILMYIVNIWFTPNNLRALDYLFGLFLFFINSSFLWISCNVLATILIIDIFNVIIYILFLSSLNVLVTSTKTLLIDRLFTTAESITILFWVSFTATILYFIFLIYVFINYFTLDLFFLSILLQILKFQLAGFEVLNIFFICLIILLFWFIKTGNFIFVCWKLSFFRGLTKPFFLLYSLYYYSHVFLYCNIFFITYIYILYGYLVNFSVVLLIILFILFCINFHGMFELSSFFVYSTALNSSICLCCNISVYCIFSYIDVLAMITSYWIFYIFSITILFIIISCFTIPHNSCFVFSGITSLRFKLFTAYVLLTLAGFPPFFGFFLKIKLIALVTTGCSVVITCLLISYLFLAVVFYLSAIKLLFSAKAINKFFSSYRVSRKCAVLFAIYLFSTVVLIFCYDLFYLFCFCLFI